MVEVEAITALGRNKKPIKIGDTVKYVNSNTVSRVSEIKKDEQGDTWALLESTDLWYREETLEITDQEIKEKKGERKFTSKEMEEKLRDQMEAMRTFELGKASGGGAGG